MGRGCVPPARHVRQSLSPPTAAPAGLASHAHRSACLSYCDQDLVPPKTFSWNRLLWTWSVLTRPGGGGASGGSLRSSRQAVAWHPFTRKGRWKRHWNWKPVRIEYLNTILHFSHFGWIIDSRRVVSTDRADICPTSCFYRTISCLFSQDLTWR